MPNSTLNSQIAAVRPRLRLGYLDGLRGLTALYVVLHHTYCETQSFGAKAFWPRWLVHASNWLQFGHFAVDIFIVLSGFCLMLPVVRGDGKLRGGVVNFFRARARRILPPYYAALAISAALFVLIPRHLFYGDWFWENSDPSAGQFNIFAYYPMLHSHPGRSASLISALAHVLLLQNLTMRWFFGFDIPMWSVATEWQIYFLFPLLLLVWRRAGTAAALLAAFVVGTLLQDGLDHAIDPACPWFLGLFTLGMAGAVISFSPSPSADHWTRLVPYARCATLLTLLLAVVGEWQSPWMFAHLAISDSLVGLATTCLLIACAGTLPATRVHPALLGLLESRALVTLGTFSYSLYLIHAPVVGVYHLLLVPLHLTPVRMFFALMSLAVPLSVGVAYLFFLAFERPFLTKRRQETPAEVARDAALSPAP